jgi:hypothetical protein
MPIAYRVDPGPMAVSPSGTVVIDHNAGLNECRACLAWQAVSTRHFVTNAGALLRREAHRRRPQPQQFNDVMGSCRSGSRAWHGHLGQSRAAAVIGFNSGWRSIPSGMIITSSVTSMDSSRTGPGLGNAGELRASAEQL